MAMLTYSSRFLDSTASACPLSDMRRRSTAASHHRRNLVTCSGGGGGGGGGGDEQRQQASPLLLDRRDILMGLGGLYGATSKMNAALAAPVTPPDFSKCQTATAPGIPADLLRCCPPYMDEHLPVTDYDYPQTPIRVRRPAHIVAKDSEYMKKYTAAVAAMKKLDGDGLTPVKPDPWSHINQAKVHCAFCNDGYEQYNNVPIQVHFSWLFLPWHRFELHFYERILGRLIDDDTFALPYWNWDNPAGMEFPAIFREIHSSLYDDKRNQKHTQGTGVIDFKYSYTDPRDDVDNSVRIRENLEWLRLEFQNGKSLPALFMGDKLVRGEAANDEASSGGLERIHNVGHTWVGSDVEPYLNMGSFVTAARDPLFYCHHANVDRVWSLFQQSRGNQVEFNDRDWLDSTFVFYDENRRLSRVKLEDSLNNLNFRVVYQDSPASYLRAQPRQAKKVAAAETTRKLQLESAKPFGDEPRRLEGEIKALVPRPTKRRSAAEKGGEVEVLIVKGIHVKDHASASFDVFVSTPRVEPLFAGRYVTVRHHTGGSGTGTNMKKRKTSLKIGLTTLLEEMEAEDDEEVEVTLKPKDGDVTIGGISIKLVKT